MKATNGWSNHGDVTLSGGAIFIKKDIDGCYCVLKNVYDEDAGVYYLFDLYVDINDGWIDWDNVVSSRDTNMGDEIDRVLGVMSYYSSANFGDVKLFTDIGLVEATLRLREVIE